MTKSSVGGWYLTAAFILSGTATTAGKSFSSILGPFTATAASLACAVPVLIPLIVRGGGPKLRDVWETAILGFCGIFLYRVFLTSALRFVGAVEAGLMIGAAPALTVAVSAAVLGERAGRRGMLGIGLTTAGIWAVGAAAGPVELGGTAGSHVAGLAMALGAAASEAVFAVLSRKTSGPRGEADPLKRTGLTALWAFAFSAFAAAAAERPVEGLGRLAPADWFALAWYGLFVTAAAYVCWYEGIRRMEACRAAPFTGIVPVVSFLLPIIILGERPGVWGCAGCALIVAGIVAAAGKASAQEQKGGTADRDEGADGFPEGNPLLLHERRGNQDQDGR